jgi:enoyl-CoA hydratase/carnithine racemase
MNELLYEVKDHVARITLNRPERLNALSIAMRRRWAEIVADMNGNPDVRVGVLMGAGDKAFCAGMDLKEMADRDAKGKRRPNSTGRPLMPAKPMVAALHGYCLAGGFELAMMCDIRVAAENAVFGLPEVRRSLVPLQAVNLLPGIVPRGEALYLALTGETIDARKALSIGLLHKVTQSKAEAEAGAERIAASIALGAPLAAQAIKELIWTNGGTATEQGYRAAFEALTRVQASEDAKEGPRAFVEKRAPRWTGR